VLRLDLVGACFKWLERPAIPSAPAGSPDPAAEQDKCDQPRLAVLGLDLAIQAEQTEAAESPFRRLLPPRLKCAF